MWEQIRANKRRSALLVIVMALILATLGVLIGAVWFGYEGAYLGVAIAVGLWLILTLITFLQGDNILLAVSGARKIEKKDAPMLYNVVEEMQLAAGLPKVPDVYIIDDPSPNAFAAGRKPEKSAVAVTTGLLTKTNRDQLEGVIAHEMSHVVNRDVLFMTVVGIMVGAIALLAEVFVRSLWFGAASGRRSRSSREGGGGQAQLIIAVVAIIFAILAPILAQVIYFACSRRREYLADANSAVLTRYPDGLASALEVIAGDRTPSQSARKALAPMYISAPVMKAGGGRKAGLFSTHPPISERVKILRAMAGGGQASFGAYQQAWKSVSKDDAGSLPASALSQEQAQPLREAKADDFHAKAPQEKLRAVGDMMLGAQQFAFLTCSCGLRIKVPPKFEGRELKCPRCKSALRPVRTARAAS
jgi:heat shock protein HtpX